MADDGPPIVVTGKSPGRDPNDLTLIVGGNELSGWEDIEVTLRAEGFPNSFHIALSSRYPIASETVVAKAGDPCTVLIGEDLVVTGYVDRDEPGGGPERHTIELIGRGQTQDLVDCSAEWPSDQLIQGNALDIATKLALPYSIAVKLGPGASAGDDVPQTCLNYTETAAAIIQRVAENAGLLAYEDASGALVLAQVGSVQASSGITYGVNVQEWTVENSMDERYSAIVCCSQSLNALSDLAGSDFFFSAPDPNVPRHRVHNVVLEQVADDPYVFTQKKAVWDSARRSGRACIVRATVDSWRDSAGSLWAPNTLVPVDVPGLREADKTLVVGEVTFRKSDETGTVAQLVLMPKRAFVPEPISLLPINAADVQGPDAP